MNKIVKSLALVSMLSFVLGGSSVFAKELPEGTVEVNDQRKEKKMKYTCPCGFSSYDLMEFLRHPFMEYPAKQDEKDLKKLEEEEK
jgi:hypothetical protein